MERVVDEKNSGLKKTVFLHTLQEGDYAVLLDWFQHDSVGPHLASVPRSVQEVKDYYESNTQSGMSSLHARLATDSEGLPIGVFGFREPDKDGYFTLERFVVNPNLQRNGYGGEMLQKALSLAFDDLNADGVRLRVGMGVENDEGTVKFYEKAGFMTEVVRLGEKKIGVFPTIGEAMTVAASSRRRVVVGRGNGWEVEANKTQMILSRTNWQQRAIS